MPRIALLEPPYADQAGALLARVMPGDTPPIGLFRMFARNLPMASAMHGWGSYELGFVAGKLTPRVRTRIAAPLLLAGSAVVVGGGFALFAAARSDLAELFAAMGVLGFGVGGFSAAMPGVILAVTPRARRRAP